MKAVTSIGFAAAVLTVVLIAAPAAAQKVAVPRDGAAQPSGDSGGGKVASGGSTSDGGQTSSGNGQPAAGRPRTAVQRTPRREGDARSGGNGRTVSRRDPAASGDSGRGSGGDDNSVPPYTRPRGSNPPTGEAVARRGNTPVRGDGGTTVWVPGGYYGGYYPWGYGGVGLGGYYGGYDDPWYYGDYQPYYSGYGYDGRLRLKVKPRNAEVLVDGYFAGLVDDFDGLFQRLHIEPGPHRIEIREPGYEPLVFDVRVQVDRTITYSGELRRLP